MVKKVIEIFTESGEDNIYASLYFQPEETIFLVNQDDYDSLPRLKHTIHYLKQKLPQTDFSFRTLDFTSVLKINKELEDLLEDSIIDVSGGEDRIKFPLIKWALKNDIQCTYIDIENQTMIHLKDDESFFQPFSCERLSIADTIYLAGGTLKEGFYENVPTKSKDILELISYALKHMNEWKLFSNYFAYLIKNYCVLNMVNQAPIDRLKNEMFKKSKIKMMRTIFRDLEVLRVLENVTIKNNYISFKVRKPHLIEYITKVGDILELYLYFEMLESNYFDEVKISNLIEWEPSEDYDNENQVINEIDIIARRKSQFFFISCKTGAVEKENIEEIVLLAQRFGTDVSYPMLATTTLLEEMTLLERSAMMDCVIIDQLDIKNKRVMQKFYEISK